MRKRTQQHSAYQGRPSGKERQLTVKESGTLLEGAKPLFG